MSALLSAGALLLLALAGAIALLISGALVDVLVDPWGYRRLSDPEPVGSESEGGESI